MAKAPGTFGWPFKLGDMGRIAGYVTGGAPKPYNMGPVAQHITARTGSPFVSGGNLIPDRQNIPGTSSDVVTRQRSDFSADMPQYEFTKPRDVGDQGTPPGGINETAKTVGSALSPFIPLAGALLTGMGIFGDLLGGDPYDEVERSIKQQFDVMRQKTQGTLGRQAQSSVGQVRKGMAGEGMSGSVVGQAIMRGVEADYARVGAENSRELGAQEATALAEVGVARKRRKQEMWGAVGGFGTSLLGGWMNSKVYG